MNNRSANQQRQTAIRTSLSPLTLKPNALKTATLSLAPGPGFTATPTDTLRGAPGADERTLSSNPC